MKDTNAIFNEMATRLMACSARDLCKEIEGKPDLRHVRMKACDHVVNDEIVQIHVMVVQDPDDFLDDFQTEVMR